jgi:intracellular septation protein A
METDMETRKPPGRLAAFKQLAVDILCGWLFLAVFLITNNIYLATAAGLATGIIQVIWMLARRQKIDPMQWMAMGLVVVLGGATIWTHDPRFVVFKPSIFEGCLAAMMLRPGWSIRYSPPQVRDLLPRWLMVAWGYVWAFCFFALAASNLVVERLYGLKAWAVWTNFSPIVLVVVLISSGMLMFPPIVRRAARARGITFSRSLAV